MTDPESLVARLDVIEARLAAHTDSERPGLTRADEGTGERWEAGQGGGDLAEVPAPRGGQDRAHPRRAGGGGAGADPLRAHESRSGPRRGDRGAPPRRPAGVAARRPGRPRRRACPGAVALAG